MRKLLIAIPYYNGDRPAAMRLAKFVCDLEPKYRDDVELCFVARHDAMPIMPSEMVQFITTFPISWHICEGSKDGHPVACNEMAREFFRHAEKMVTGGQWSTVDAILFMEPDCVPVARDWIDQLRDNWDKENEDRESLEVVGCYRHINVDVPHVNGNALWSPRVASKHDFADVPGLGWDSALAREMTPEHWANTPLISNLFKERNVADARLRHNPFHSVKAVSPVLIHGVKDESAWHYAKKMTAL